MPFQTGIRVVELLLLIIWIRQLRNFWGLCILVHQNQIAVYIPSGCAPLFCSAAYKPCIHRRSCYDRYIFNSTLDRFAHARSCRQSSSVLSCVGRNSVTFCIIHNSIILLRIAHPCAGNILCSTCYIFSLYSCAIAIHGVNYRAFCSSS